MPSQPRPPDTPAGSGGARDLLAREDPLHAADLTEVPSAFRLPRPGPHLGHESSDSVSSAVSSAGSSLWSRPNRSGSRVGLPAPSFPARAPARSWPLSSFSVNAERYESSTAREQGDDHRVHASRVWSAVRCIWKSDEEAARDDRRKAERPCPGSAATPPTCPWPCDYEIEAGFGRRLRGGLGGDGVVPAAGFSVPSASRPSQTRPGASTVGGLRAGRTARSADSSRGRSRPARRDPAPRPARPKHGVQVLGGLSPPRRSSRRARPAAGRACAGRGRCSPRPAPARA